MFADSLNTGKYFFSLITRNYLSILLIVTFINSNLLIGDELDLHPKDVIHWTSMGATQLEDGAVEVSLSLKTDKNFSIYKDKLKVVGPIGFSIAANEVPVGKIIVDPVEGKKVEVFYSGNFKYRFQGFERFDEKQPFVVKLTYLGCTEKICLFPYTEDIEVSFGMASYDPLSNKTSDLNLENTSNNSKPFKNPTHEKEVLSKKIDKSSESEETNRSLSDMEQDFAQSFLDGDLSLNMLLFALFLGGILTNLTPCVFPMIPITVRILARQGSKPIVGSSFYCLGIILSYSLLGLAVSQFGGLFGSFLANPIVNLVIAIVFSLLALTMLGIGNLNFLQNLGNKLGSGKPSVFNTMFMGMGAGLVAAPCTGPILGALIAFTIKTNQGMSSLWMFSLYSFGFALPYLFLGMAAGKISKLKVSPAIQVSTKYFFASVMFGLAFYFLRINYYELTKALKPFWGMISSVSFSIAVVSIVVMIMRRSFTDNKPFSIVLSLFLGLGLFSFSQKITHPPKSEKITWHSTDEAAISEGSQQGKPILVDGWAEWCEACKKMDATTYKDKKVLAELENWSLAKLDLTLNSDEDQILIDKYEMYGLPVIVLLDPSGDLSKGSKKISGYVSAEKLVSILRKFRLEGK